MVDSNPRCSNFVQGLRGFFDCPLFSDLTVRCAVKDFYAHRLVLASQSPYFAHALTNLDESSSGTSILRLDDENPLVIEAVLFYMYNLDYSDGSGVANGCEDMGLNIQVYLAAVKFGMDGLRFCSVERFAGAARRQWNSACFLRAISCLYEQERPQQHVLRQIVAQVAAKNALELLKRSDFLQLKSRIFSFKVEFDRAMAQIE